MQTLESYGHIKKKRGAGGGSIILPILPDNGINLILNYLKQQKYTAEELIEARVVFEPLIVELAAKKLTDKDKDKLRNALDIHEKDYNIKKTSRLGWESNLIYSELTHNKIIMVIEELLIRILLDLEFSLGMTDLESPEEFNAYDGQSFSGHKEIIGALLSGDTDKARKAAENHKMRWGSLLLDILKKKKPKRKK